jgi:hypothetical protein
MHPEPLPDEHHLELPYPPAVTMRRPPVAPDDDGLLMPPFSRAAFVAPIVPAAASATPSASAGAAAGMEAVASPSQPRGQDELAEEVAGRLERMADDLRRLGFHALLEPRTEREPIDVVLASVIAGFLARR